jgi:putative phosphoesterase
MQGANKVKIGIISDTHDNIPNIKKAVGIFNANKVGLVIHAGDYIAPFSIAPFDDLKCDFVGVFGNNDGEKQGLTKISQGKIKPQPHKLEFYNKKILIIHEPNDLDDLIKSQHYDIIIYGHTHEHVIDHGKTLVINPGECCGWLTGKGTVALADLNDMKASIVELD